MTSTARFLLTGIAIICAAQMPGHLWGQWTGGPTGPIYYTGGSVGIGTTNPAQKLSVFGSSGVPGLGSNNAGLAWFGEGAGGNAINIGYYYASGQTPYGWIQSQFVGSVAAYYPLALNPSGGNIGIGTAAPQYKLAVNGTIGAKEVIVTNTGWPDYVFKRDYQLKPLTEVAAYINKHHHLPEIPSASEVRAKGVSLGAMQAQLLAKVEELTLHMIQADEKNRQLDRKNRELQERITRLEARNGESPTPDH